MPDVPNKVYFTISEVAHLCDLKSHVLRYWEQEFTRLAPAKRRGNRRYYQRKDVEMIRRIRQLLYTEGFTIEGAKKQLAQHKEQPAAPSTGAVQQADSSQRMRLIAQLEDVVALLQTHLVP